MARPILRPQDRPMGETTETAIEVLVVAEHGEAGGIGRYCVDLATLHGHRARLVCLCPGPCRGTECWLAEQSATHGVGLIRVPMPAQGWRSGLAGLVRVWKATGRPVVHVNGRRGNFVSLVARLVVPGFRFVTTVHGALGLHARRNALYRVIDLAAARAATAVIAVSFDTRARLARMGGPTARMVVIQNGLGDPELRTFATVAMDRLPDRAPIRFGFLGRLSPEKGTRELVAIARALLAGSPTATLAIAGDGPDLGWLGPALSDLAGNGRVTCVGAVRDADDFLGEIDVLVMPSHNEGLPYSLLEAMAAGCAVVAYRVGGVPEVITGPSLGILVDPGDLDGFVAAVLELAADPGRVGTLGRASAEHIATNFALRDRRPQIARVYWQTSAVPVAPAADTLRPND